MSAVTSLSFLLGQVLCLASFFPNTGAERVLEAPQVLMLSLERGQGSASPGHTSYSLSAGGELFPVLLRPQIVLESLTVGALLPSLQLASL